MSRTGHGDVSANRQLVAPLAAQWAKYDVEGKGYLTETEAYMHHA